MLRTFNIGIRFPTVKVKQVCISAGVRLLVISPVQIVKGVIIHFAYALEKYPRIKTCPFSAQVNSITYAPGDVSNDRQIFGIINGRSLFNHFVTVEVLVPWP